MKPAAPAQPRIRTAAQAILVAGLRLYRRGVSPVLGAIFGPTAGCRFSPTCSAYALEAVQTHGPVAGSILALRRLARCHPWGGCGHDPVPPAAPSASAAAPVESAPAGGAR